MADPTPAAAALSPERIAEIRAKVAESRKLRADAGEEALRLTGSAVVRSVIPAGHEAYARLLNHQHEYVRWANQTLLELAAAGERLERRVAELTAVTALLDQAREWVQGEYDREVRITMRNKGISAVASGCRGAATSGEQPTFATALAAVLPARATPEPSNG